MKARGPVSGYWPRAFTYFCSTLSTMISTLCSISACRIARGAICWEISWSTISETVSLNHSCVGSANSRRTTHLTGRWKNGVCQITVSAPNKAAIPRMVETTWSASINYLGAGFGLQPARLEPGELFGLEDRFRVGSECSTQRNNVMGGYVLLSTHVITQGAG